MPKIGMSPIRKQQLINATVNCIDKKGIANTTIKDIAHEANLSPSIISHYFDGKMDLLRETMLDLMRGLRSNIAQKNKCEKALTPIRAIEIIIECNFDTELSKKARRVWLSFWAMSMHQDELHRLQKINDNRLHSNLLAHYKKILPLPQAQDAARGLAALIDGLWLHGSLRNEEFDAKQAQKITLNFFYNTINNKR